MQTVVVANFRFRHEAELARAFLDAEGIECIVAADDGGGAQPGISRASVLVRTEDESLAREVLSRESRGDS